MCDKKATVTCWYCLFFEYKCESETDFPMEGFCEFKKASRQIFDEICDNFEINPCVHTKKYYPKKND